MDQILAGKTGVVFGVANKRSIAWAAAGARLIFNYQGERLKENVEELVGEFGAETPLYPCDRPRGRLVRASWNAPIEPLRRSPADIFEGAAQNAGA